MTSLTVENYVKAILMICQLQGGEAASTGAIAERLHVSPGTVTSMLKTLRESGLAVYTPYEGVQLTEAGRALALRVVRRHRLIELFLVETLGLSWDEVHDEAENMEHAVSDFLVDRIDQFLGLPPLDPHGDPIPRADGTIQSTSTLSLWEVPIGKQFRLSRVADQNTDFLRYLSDQNLQLGSAGRVIEHSPQGDSMTLTVDRRQVTLSRQTAEKLYVESQK